MKRYTKEELKVVLDKHSEWLLNNSKGERADLRRADLREANLGGADLRGADLGGANLSDTCINTFSLGRHSGYSWTNKDGKFIIKIGCKEMLASQWKDEYKEIGKSQGYTDKQIKLYGDMIEILLKSEVN